MLFGNKAKHSNIFSSLKKNSPTKLGNKNDSKCVQFEAFLSYSSHPLIFPWSNYQTIGKERKKKKNA